MSLRTIGKAIGSTAKRIGNTDSCTLSKASTSTITSRAYGLKIATIPSTPPPHGEMFIDTLQPSEIEDAARLVGEAFANREPLSVRSGLTADEMTEWTKEVLTNCIDESMSFAARLPPQGQLVACLIAETAKDEPPPAFKNPKGQALLDLLRSLHEGLEYKERSKGDTLHLFMAATHELYERGNICSELVEHALTKAKESGRYRRVVAELTGPWSQRIFLDKLQGFTPVKEIAYNDTEAFKGPGSIVLVEGNLDNM